VGAGDEVIAVPTVSAIQVLGARPVFVDIRDDDFLMDVTQVETAITPRTDLMADQHPLVARSPEASLAVEATVRRTCLTGSKPGEGSSVFRRAYSASAGR
jgi:DegT/DnrJ/EryC1/StrS aminotransferase family